VPWLAAPAVILLAASQAHPLYTGRYLEFSQPALALLCAAGLAGDHPGHTAAVAA